MRKKGARLLVAALILCLALPLAMSFTVNAAVNKATVVSDNFNYSSLDTDKWETMGEAGAVQLSDNGGALQMYSGQFHKSANWMGLNPTATETGTPITGDYTLEAVVSRECGAGDWLGIYTGMSTCDLDFQTIKGDMIGNAGNVLVLNNNSISNYSENGKLYGDPVTVDVKNDGTPYKIKLDYKKGATYAENTVDIYLVEYNPENQAEYGEKKGTLGSVSVDGYFGFGSASTGTVTVSQLRILQNGEVFYECDFKGDIIDFIYGAQPQDSTKQFRVWCTYENEFAAMFRTGQVSTVKLESTEAANALATKAEVTADSGVVEYLDLSYSLKPLKLDGKTGISFGTTAQGSTGRIVLENSGDPATTKLYAESGNGTKGAEIDLQEDITSAAFRKLKVVCRIGGQADVYYRGVKAGTVSGIDSFAGRIAFFTEGGSVVEIDDVNIFGYSSIEDTGRNLAVDFTRKRDGQIYVDTKEDWYMTGNVFLQNGRAAFTNAVPGAVFGPRDKYGDYVLKFDVLNITQGVNSGGIEGQVPNPRCSWFGLSLGRGSRDQDFLTTPMVMFAPRPDVGDTKVTSMYVECLNMAMEDGGTSAAMKENFFEDGAADEAKKRINIVLVVNNRTVKLYYKYADQPESELDAPKAVFTDVNTYGYVAVVCNYGGNFSISNVSINNLSAANNSVADEENLAEEKQQTAGTVAVGEAAQGVNALAVMSVPTVLGAGLAVTGKGKKTFKGGKRQ